MKLGRIDWMVFAAQTLHFGFRVAARREHQIPTGRRIGNLPTMAFHHLKFHAEIGKDRIVTRLADPPRPALEDATRVIAAGSLVDMADVRVNGQERTVRIADPAETHPQFQKHIYWVPVQRLINAILLGVLTYDGNMLVLEPPEDSG